MRGPYLLDTCACHWLVDDTLTKDAATALTDAYNAGLSTYISPITALEVATLARKRRFRSPLTPRRWFESLMQLSGLAQAEMSAGLLIESQSLPGDIHKDPYDRIIAATAREYGYTVMTRDRALLDYGGQGYLSVMPC
ncbi:MAG TPA: type II toxin-antitoxin system VapC family toxin [Rhizomicrobium sp.]